MSDAQKAPAPSPDQFVGWYDKPEQAQPAHMPENPPCPVCGESLGDIHAASWVSLMFADRRKRSLFYGVHQDCKREPRDHLDEAVLSWSAAS